MDASHPFPTAYAVGYMSNARFAGYTVAAYKHWNGYPQPARGVRGRRKASRRRVQG